MSEDIRVIVNGAKGKMGQETVMAVNNADGLSLVAEIDLGDDLEQSIKNNKADVVIDFTAPDCAFKNCKTIIQSKAGGVIGTTGFTADQIAELQEECADREPAVLIAPNFSISALLMMHCSTIAAKYMSEVEIIELHHPGKKDAPSGTAIKTAELIAESRNQNVPRGTNEPAARGERFCDIPVHSVRLTGFLAHQEVIFGGEGQTLSIRQDSLNRTCFMPGVVLGVREVMKRKGLIYGLDQILFEVKMEEKFYRGFIELIENRNLSIDSSCIKKIAHYFYLLDTDNKEINLTGYKTLEDFIDFHLIDSLSINNFINLEEKSTVMDVGTGAGIPGIILKLLNPSIKLILIESIKKKTQFLEKVKNELSLYETTILSERAEILGQDTDWRETADFTIARALSSFSTAMELMVPLTRVNGKIILPRGSNEDKREENRLIKLFGCELVECQNYQIPRRENPFRLLIIKKNLTTGEKYPRKPGQIKKRPL